MDAPAGITIARWTAADRLDEILRVVYAAFAGFQPPSGVLDETVDDLARRLREGIVIVAQAGDEFVGSVFCAAQGDALYLMRMAVLPVWRRRGIGRALMAAAQDEARRTHLAKLLLRVRKSLPGNRVYFAAQGFVVTGEGQDPGREPYDIMERPLGPA